MDAALYRLEEPLLARALGEAQRRGVRVRLVLDRGKFFQTLVTRKLIQEHALSCRLISGRTGKDGKMHHKFALVDGRVVFTGSYNWTVESEVMNYDNLVVIRDPAVAEVYRREFDALWREAKEPD